MVIQSIPENLKFGKMTAIFHFHWPTANISFSHIGTLKRSTNTLPWSSQLTALQQRKNEDNLRDNKLQFYVTFIHISRWKKLNLDFLNNSNLSWGFQLQGESLQAFFKLNCFMIMTHANMDTFYVVLNVLMLTSRYIYTLASKHSVFLLL